MQRFRKHQTACNKILQLADNRLSGDLRVLIELLALWLDAEEPDRSLLGDILSGTFGKRLRYKNPNEPPEPAADSGLEADTRKQIREALSLLGE